jgi:hypothetical protein
MSFQVYFKKALDPSEWGRLPEYCQAILSLLNSNDKTTIINDGLVDSVFAHASPQPVFVLEGSHIIFALPDNSILQREQLNRWPDHPFQIQGGYTVAGIIIQEENAFLPGEHHEICQQVSLVYVHFVLHFLCTST